MEKAGRNDPCPCGSGKKFKKCCEMKSHPKKFQATVISPAGGESLVQKEAQKLSPSLFHRIVQIQKKEEPPRPEEPKNPVM